MTNSVTRVDVDPARVLCRELKQLHLQVGEPKFTDLEELSLQLKEGGSGVRFLSKSSINDTVRGKRVKVPDWDWVLSFVTVCRVHAERTRSPRVGQLPGTDYWYDRWYKAKRASITTAPWRIVGTSSADPDGLPDALPAAAAPPLAAPVEGKRAERPRAAGGLVESLTADRYRETFGEHAVELLQAAEDDHDLEACCRLGLLLTCVGSVDEGSYWLSVAARDGEDPIAVAVLQISLAHPPEGGPTRREFAAECLYDMAVAEGYRLKRTRASRPADWIDLYLEIASRGGGHLDAAYHLAVRHRARGNDNEAAYLFALADRRGHRKARRRFETIYEQIRHELLDNGWIEDTTDDAES